MGIKLRQGPQLGVGAKHQIDAAAGALEGAAAAVPCFEAGGGCGGGGPDRAHVEQMQEKIVAEGADPIRPDPMARGIAAGAQDAQAADEDRHFRGTESEQLGLVQQQLLRRNRKVLFLIVAEAIGQGFEHGKGFDVGLLLGGVGATRREGHLNAVAAGLGRGFDGSIASQHNQIGDGDLFAAAGLAVELLLNRREHSQHLGQLGRLVGGPVLLRRQAQPGPIGAAPFIRAPKSGGRGPGGGHQFANREG